MKKLFYFAAAAMMMAACTSEELNVQDQQKLAEDNSAVNFDVYTLRGVTRAGTPGDITDGNIKEGAHQADGFGVFAFYTNEKEYDQSSTPNFMYNQKVVWNGSKWAYEPVKYWPNEFGNAAISDNIDYVTFFAYAPWTQFEPTTGKPVIKTGADVTETAEHQQNFNIFEIKSNKVSGDPIIKYRVDTDPATSVDLLWGVNADPTTWAPIQASSATVTKNEAGYPFLNLLKPSDPVNGKIKFNLRHALAKVKITIDYVADQQTPAVDAAPDDFKSDSIDMAKTRIFVRSLEMDGFALEGALNLNNDVKDHPLWTDLNGKELNFSPVVFNDGRSDGKEGTDGGTKKEENAYLNPEIVENFANTTTRNDTIIFNGGYAGVANGQKNPGVRMHGSDITQLLFGGDPGTNNGYFYVIPRDTENQKVNVKIKYGVLTLDSNLPGKLSGSTDFGSDIENIIEKTDIFNGLDFKAGYQYQINIHLGMTSVKIDAQVEPWDKGSDPTNVNLPDNQLSLGFGIQEAIKYNYSDYTYKGTFTLNSDEDATPALVAYTTNSANPEDMMNDTARLLGALYRAGGITSITYDGNDYTWDPANAGNLKGSNWYNSDKGTLVSVLTAQYIAGSLSSPLTFTTNKGDIQVTF
jgi:hypothetical protein